MEEALIQHLLAFSPLQALVADRVTWLTRPQRFALPAVVLQLVSAVPDEAYFGPTGLKSTRVQAECWAETFAAAKAVSRTLITSVTPAPDGFQGVFVDAERDDADETASPILYRSAIDLIVWRNPA